MRGSDFMRALPAGGDTRSVVAREQLVLDAVTAGLALPIVWTPLKTSAGLHTGTIFVATDTLRFGVPGPNADPSDWDWVRVAVTPDTAQRIADALGVLLPTDRIADLAHAQADVRLTPHTQHPVTATTAAMLHHHAAIEAERAGREGLLSTIGKEWILGPELFPAGYPAHPLGHDGAINYGWHTVGPVTPDGPYPGRSGMILWQTRGFRHNRRHVDYSQWAPRVVHPRMRVDGRNVSTAEVMMSPELSGLASDHGPLLDTRYPLQSRGGANPSTTASTATTSAHRTFSPVDRGAAASHSDPFAELWRNATSRR
jgi:hypothetical protein